ncbi:MAG: hypothetical protein IV107_07765 [Paucibacter sp.]|nr:hypothetical protein [Roseateles sp.]
MKAFPVKIPTLWRQAFPALVLGAIVTKGHMWFQGQPFSLPDKLPLMGVAAAVVAGTYFLQPTLAGPLGLKVMSSWGFRRFVAWSEIESVALGRLYFVQPSLKLLDAQGRAYWIALDTKDMRGLYDLALACGGSAHPLTQALETPLFAL